MRLTADRIQSLVADQSWEGTITALARALVSPVDGWSPPAAHLAIWIRRHEPSLWWDHGISVRFSRNGRRRLVHLARREMGIAGLTARV
jgi:hypothetical protein